LPQAPNSDLYKFPSEKKKGIIGTIIFHIVLAVILIITGFHTPLPLPEEDGILVNFGTDETGSGLIEPSSQPGGEAASIPDQTEEEILSDNEVAVPVTAAESTLTQEFEEAVEVEKRIEQPDPEEERKRQQAIEAERLRQQQAEEERLRKEAEEVERKKIEEEQERLRKEAEERQQRLDNITNRTRNALDRSNAAGSDSGISEGIAGGEGNQGVVTGAAGADNYGAGGGTGTEGVSYDLAGRQFRSLPKPKYDIQNEGVVVVEITVDRNGDVTQALSGVKGSTTLEDYFLRVAQEAAMNAKFDRKPDAPVIQKGFITYHFILR